MSELTMFLNARRANKPTIFELEGKKIKPCPFCGLDDVSMDSDSTLGEILHWCCCSTCGCEGPVRSTRLRAVRVWQMRGRLVNAGEVEG